MDSNAGIVLIGIVVLALFTIFRGCPHAQESADSMADQCVRSVLHVVLQMEVVRSESQG